jgi:penicillin-binding protein-related factor A (putative recombinase)
LLNFWKHLLVYLGKMILLILKEAKINFQLSFPVKLMIEKQKNLINIWNHSKKTSFCLQAKIPTKLNYSTIISTHFLLTFRFIIKNQFKGVKVTWPQPFLACEKSTLHTNLHIEAKFDVRVKKICFLVNDCVQR